MAERHPGIVFSGSAELAKELTMDTREFIDRGTVVWNNRDRDGFLALCDENTEMTGPGGLSGRGIGFAAAFWSGWQDAFPDNHITIGTIVSEGSEGAEESVFEGTHTGVLSGPAGEIAPTHRRVSMPFVGLHTVRNDKWVSFRVYFDQVELLTQLGVMPVSATT